MPRKFDYTKVNRLSNDFFENSRL